MAKFEKKNRPSPKTITELHRGDQFSVPYELIEIDQRIKNPEGRRFDPENKPKDRRLVELMVRDGFTDPIHIEIVQTSAVGPDGKPKLRYVLRNGHRRYHAVPLANAELERRRAAGEPARKENIVKVPFIEYDGTNKSDMDRYAFMIESNDRNEVAEEMSLFDLGALYQKFHDLYHMTNDQIADTFGKSHGFVASCKKLNGATPAMREMVERGEISISVVRQTLRDYPNRDEAEGALLELREKRLAEIEAEEDEAEEDGAAAPRKVAAPRTKLIVPKMLRQTPIPAKRLIEYMEAAIRVPSKIESDKILQLALNGEPLPEAYRVPEDGEDGTEEGGKVVSLQRHKGRAA